jgi:hypothetical protein
MKRSPPSRKTALRTRKRTLRPSRSTGRPTVAESARMGRLKAMGCVACHINRERGLYDKCPGWPYADAHHLLSGGRRRGHLFTLALCKWHHVSHPPIEGMGIEDAIRVYGPSLERQKAFRDYYGTDDELLVLQNAILRGDS